MISLGLSAADRETFEATLAQSHRIRVTVRIHDRHEQVITTMPTDRVLSGAVHIDTSQEEGPARTLEVTLLEPRAVSGWLPAGPGEASVYADNFVSVLYGVDVPSIGWVDVPVFWGPIIALDDDGDQVTIRAAGKEVLALDPAWLWRTYTVPKGVKRTTAVRRLLGEQGEARFDFPELPAKLGKPLSLARDAQPWQVVDSVVAGMDRQVFYDGLGRVRIRQHPGNRVFSFRTGDGGTVLSKPKVSYDLAEVRNVVEVLGPEPTGPTTRIRAVARAPSWHPLSPESLGRNGEPRWLVHRVDSDLEVPGLEQHATTNGGTRRRRGVPSRVRAKKRQRRHRAIVTNRRKAEQIAGRELDDLLTTTVDVTFDALPVPHLEEGDRVAVHADGQHIEFRIKQLTIPLVAGEAMTVGTNVKASWRRRKVGQRR